MYRDSSKTQAIVSWIIAAFAAIYVAYWIYQWVDYMGHYILLSFTRRDYISLSIFLLLLLPILILQLAILRFILWTKESKYRFTNYIFLFHPFYKNWNKRYETDYIYVGCYLTFVYVVMYFNDSTNMIPFSLYSAFLIHYGLLSLILGRNKVLELFPVDLYEGKKIRLLVSYEDYQNKKIADDQPHLEIGQSFTIFQGSYPRNESERLSVEVRNNSTPIVPALITCFRDEFLSNFLKNGGELHARLIGVREFSILELEIWTTKNSENFIKENQID